MTLDRVKGDFSTFFRNATLTKVMTDMVATGGPITYFNITGGNVAHQLKESHVHKDAVYLYKWLRLPIGLRRIPKGIAALQPWLEQFAYANEDVPVDAFGFPKDLYLPGVDFIANRILRPQDKHVIFETEEHMLDLLNLAFGNDPRVEINTSGLRTEEDLKALFPTYGRALVHVDIHESTTFAEQKRARNALFGFLKRMPHATYCITYPLYEDNHPYEFLDAFARTGMQTGYGTSQFADDLATERQVVSAIVDHAVPSTVAALSRHMGGQIGRPVLNTWAPKESHNDNLLPTNIEVFRPRSYWTGAGALVFNAGNDATPYTTTLNDLGDSLRAATGKPPGMRYGMSGPLYEPQSYEVGVAWGHKHSFVTPGWALPEDYYTMTMDEIRENLDHKFIDELMDKMEYIPMKGGPTNFFEIGLEQSKLTPQGKRLVEDSEIKHKKSKKQQSRQTPLGVYNKLVAFARNQDLKDFRTNLLDRWQEEHNAPLNEFAHRHAANGIENNYMFLSLQEKVAPTYHETEAQNIIDRT